MTRLWVCPTQPAGQAAGQAAIDALTAVVPRGDRPVGSVAPAVGRAALIAHALVRIAIRQRTGRWVTDGYQRTCGCGSRSHGKPSLPASGVHFSLAHTTTWVAVAVADRPVGVDIEPVDPAIDWLALAASLFAGDERRVLADLPDRAGAATQIWTRKEAVLKAAGMGFVRSASSVDVSRTGRVEIEDVAYWVRDVVADRSIAAAVATTRDGPVTETLTTVGELASAAYECSAEAGSSGRGDSSSQA